MAKLLVGGLALLLDCTKAYRATSTSLKLFFQICVRNLVRKLMQKRCYFFHTLLWVLYAIILLRCSTSNCCRKFITNRRNESSCYRRVSSRMIAPQSTTDRIKLTHRSTKEELSRYTAEIAHSDQDDRPHLLFRILSSENIKLARFPSATRNLITIKRKPFLNYDQTRGARFLITDRKPRE